MTRLSRGGSVLSEYGKLFDKTKSNGILTYTSKGLKEKRNNCT